MIAILAGLTIPLALTAWVLLPLKPHASSPKPQAGCVACRARLEPGARFCSNCGAPVQS